MAELSIDQAKQVYRAAIDAKVSDAEGDDWWMAVTKEVRDVCASRSVKAGAAVIEWWHHDWSAVGDTSKAAAQRIRQAAKNI
ncbi:hypothetical protein LJR129_005061 [Acidovorax sp. LjRoot129]|uniref:hypothetical protein n=1 Tax=unclassified Acidovorax TaxID=2684926 RepID=UPI003ECC7F83